MSKNRDESGDVGSGRRKITRDDKGKLSKDKDKDSDATHPPTSKELDDKDKR